MIACLLFFLLLSGFGEGSMLLLAHTGITLGAAVLVAGGLASVHPSPSVESKADEPSHRSSQSVLSRIIHPVRQASSWLTALGRRVDIRLLLIAALLPDIIDKPVGHLFFREALSNGRIFGHTLLFLIVITFGGLYLYYGHKKTWLLVFSFGSFTHLVLDRIWLTPKTLLWPLYGFSFERLDLNYWVKDLFYSLLTNPLVLIPDLVGISVIGWFVWFLMRKGAIGTIIRKGRI